MENEKIIMNKLDDILIALTNHIRTSDERFDQVDERFQKVDERFEKIDERFEKIDERFEKIDERFEKIDERLEKADSRFEKIEGDLQALKNGQKSIRIDLQKMSQRIDDTYELALSTWGDHEETKMRLSSLEA